MPQSSDTYVCTTQHWYVPIFLDSFTYLRTVFWKNYIFHRAVVSEVHVLQTQDPHFRKPLKLKQFVYFEVGHISTRRDNSNAPKIIAIRWLNPEIVRSESPEDCRMWRDVTHHQHSAVSNIQNSNGWITIRVEPPFRSSPCSCRRAKAVDVKIKIQIQFQMRLKWTSNDGQMAYSD